MDWLKFGAKQFLETVMPKTRRVLIWPAVFDLLSGQPAIKTNPIKSTSDQYPSNA